MASGDHCFVLPIQEAYPKNGGSLHDGNPILRRASETKPHIKGISFPANSDTEVEWTAFVALLGAAAGVTVKLALQADPRDSGPGGVAARFGVTIKKLAANETVEDAGFGTEVTADITMDATAGEIVIGTVAISNANADAIAKGDLVLVKIRRIGTHANDAFTGNALLLGVQAVET